MKKEKRPIIKEADTLESISALEKSNKAYQEQVKNLTAMVERLWAQKAVMCLKSLETLVSRVGFDYGVCDHIRMIIASALQDAPMSLNSRRDDDGG